MASAAAISFLRSPARSWCKCLIWRVPLVGEVWALRPGTCKTRTFPRERVMQVMVDTKRETEAAAGRRETMRILVIEDDREAATWLIKGLTESGHVADLASNGEEGLALARERIHDVLIVDRMLPVIDGLTIIRTLRTEGNKTPA